MNCEQFEGIVLDLDRDGSVTPLERAGALAHLNTCSRCAALQESWQAARQELRALGEATVEAQTPARVEMRLLLEFRRRHHQILGRRVVIAAAWAVAAAAVLVGAVSLRNWQRTRTREAARHETVVPAALKKDLPLNAQNGVNNPSGQVNNLDNTIASDDNGGDFTPLPGVLWAETDQSSVLRVRMQRATLGALGFPVSEDGASDWIQVDLMVGDDGVPQAVRLAQ